MSLNSRVPSTVFVYIRSIGEGTPVENPMQKIRRENIFRLEKNYDSQIEKEKGSNVQSTFSTLSTCCVWKRRNQFGGLALKRNNTSQQWCFNCRLKIYYVLFIQTQTQRPWNTSKSARKYIPIKIYERIATKWRKASWKNILVLVAYFFSTCFSSNSYNTHWNADFLSFLSSENFLNLLLTFFSFFVFRLFFINVICVCVCHMNPYFLANNTHWQIPYPNRYESLVKPIVSIAKQRCWEI